MIMQYVLRFDTQMAFSTEDYIHLITSYTNITISIYHNAGGALEYIKHLKREIPNDQLGQNTN